MSIVCYLVADKTARLTYRGYSTNIKRRLLQHKQILKGGAKYTRKFKECNLVLYLSGFTTKKIAMSFEWYTKKKRYPCVFKLQDDIYSSKASRFLSPLTMNKFQHLTSTLTLNLNRQYFSHNIVNRIHQYFDIKVNIFRDKSTT